MIIAAARIAFQGEHGSFSEDAITAFFGSGDLTRIGLREFDDVRSAVLSGRVDYGVLPVENSIHGRVAGAHAAMDAGGLTIIGEITCPIRLCLLAAPTARPEQLRRVLSHPVALDQCRRFLASMPLLEPVPFYDTAGAAKEVAARADTTSAAIASEAAAAYYRLDIISRGVEDRSDNRTRFAIVARADGHRL